jgi:ClpP class serine protease
MRRFIPFLPKPAVVPVIRLSGTIGTGTRSLNDEALAPLIDKAFRMKPVAVALVVNSPGGSAVQSSLIAARIRRLADEKKVPVHAWPVRRMTSGWTKAASSARSA